LAATSESTVIYYDERWVTIRWDETIQAGWAEYKGYAEGEEFRAAYEANLQLLRQKRACRWLSDARLLAPISQADQRWLNNDWLPRMIAAGLRWSAVVSPRAAVSRLTVKQIVSKINNVSLVTDHFDDLEAARSWLRSQPAP
jgi:hypothetical protein